MPSNALTPTAIVLRFLPVLVCMGTIYFISDQPTLPTIPSVPGQIMSVIGHFTVYFVLAVVLWWALGIFPLSSRRRYAVAFTIAVLYGVSDEWHQSFVPGRNPDVLDIVTDAIGAATGLLVIHLAQRSARLRTMVPQ
jgi:VanZ family protein